MKIRSTMIMFFFLLVILAILQRHSLAKSTGHPSMRGSMTLLMTVDWEGRDLRPSNLKAMRDFRVRHPEISMLHFLNPAYYTKGRALSDELLTRKISEVLRKGDEMGLHIHGWKSLLETCGLRYKWKPSFADSGDNYENCSGSQGDCGHTVSLEFAYSKTELSKLVACSKEILIDKGFDVPQSFRAGGWQLGPKLSEALVNNGLKFDSSQTPTDFVVPSWGYESSIVKMINELFPNASIYDQPYEIYPGLIEYPDNAGLADYTEGKVLLQTFKALLKENKKIMVIGFHQETAASYLPRIEEGISLIMKEAKKQNTEINWQLLPLK